MSNPLTIFDKQGSFKEKISKRHYNYNKTFYFLFPLSNIIIFLLATIFYLLFIPIFKSFIIDQLGPSGKNITDPFHVPAYYYILYIFSSIEVIWVVFLLIVLIVPRDVIIDFAEGKIHVKRKFILFYYYTKTYSLTSYPILRIQKYNDVSSSYDLLSESDKNSKIGLVSHFNKNVDYSVMDSFTGKFLLYFSELKTSTDNIEHLQNLKVENSNAIPIKEIAIIFMLLLLWVLFYYVCNYIQLEFWLWF